MRQTRRRGRGLLLALALLATVSGVSAEGRDQLEAEIKLTVGTAFMNHDEFAEALTRFQEAVQLAPENGTAHFLAATALIRLERYDDALQELDQARRLGAQAPPGRLDWFSGEAAYRLADFAQAESAFRKAVEADPHDADARFYLGLTLLQLGRAAEAGPQFDRAEELDPELAGSATFFAGKSLYESGDLAGARREFDKALGSTGTSENARKASTNYLTGIADLESSGPPRWELSIGLGAESDDNVLVSPDDPSLGTTSESDARAVITLKADYYPFYDKRGWSLGLILLAYQNVYQDRSDLDLTVPQSIVSLTWGKDPQGWVNGPIGFTWVPTGSSPAVFTLQAASTYGWLDGESYLRTNELGTNVKIPEGRWSATQLDLDYRSNTFFQGVARSGDFIQARAVQYFYLGRRERQLRLGLRAATNDADGSSIDLSGTSGEFCSANPGPDCIDLPTEMDLIQDGGTSFDYDYDEAETWIDVALPLGRNVSLFAQASFQRQDYDNVNSNPQLRGPDPTELRQDDRLTLSTSIVWGITPHWNLIARYAYFDNESNKDAFTYTRGVAGIGINWYY